MEQTYRAYDNGTYRDMTEEEISEIMKLRAEKEFDGGDTND